MEISARRARPVDLRGALFTGPSKNTRPAASSTGVHSGSCAQTCTPATARYSRTGPDRYWCRCRVLFLNRLAPDWRARAGLSQNTRPAAASTATRAHCAGLPYSRTYNDTVGVASRAAAGETELINASAEHKIESVCSTRPYCDETHPGQTCAVYIMYNNNNLYYLCLSYT